MNLKPACIAQLIQVELLRRRLRLAQIHGTSLANSRIFSPLQYNKGHIVKQPKEMKLQLTDSQDVTTQVFEPLQVGTAFFLRSR